MRDESRSPNQIRAAMGFKPIDDPYADMARPVRTISGTMRVSKQMIGMMREDELFRCRAYDVPPWVVLSWYPVPRFPKLRWRLRRVWRFR